MRLHKHHHTWAQITVGIYRTTFQRPYAYYQDRVTKELCVDCGSTRWVVVGFSGIWIPGKSPEDEIVQPYLVMPP